MVRGEVVGVANTCCMWLRQVVKALRFLRIPLFQGFFHHLNVLNAFSRVRGCVVHCVGSLVA